LQTNTNQMNGQLGQLNLTYSQLIAMIAQNQNQNQNQSQRRGGQFTINSGSDKDELINRTMIPIADYSSGEFPSVSLNPINQTKINKGGSGSNMYGQYNIQGQGQKQDQNIDMNYLLTLLNNNQGQGQGQNIDMNYLLTLLNNNQGQGQGININYLLTLLNNSQRQGQGQNINLSQLLALLQSMQSQNNKSQNNINRYSFMTGGNGQNQNINLPIKLGSAKPTINNKPTTVTYKIEAQDNADANKKENKNDQDLSSMEFVKGAPELSNQMDGGLNSQFTVSGSMNGEQISNDDLKSLMSGIQVKGLNNNQSGSLNDYLQNIASNFPEGDSKMMVIDGTANASASSQSSTPMEVIVEQPKMQTIPKA